MNKVTGELIDEVMAIEETRDDRGYLLESEEQRLVSAAPILAEAMKRVEVRQEIVRRSLGLSVEEMNQIMGVS